MSELKESCPQNARLGAGEREQGLEGRLERGLDEKTIARRAGRWGRFVGVLGYMGIVRSGRRRGTEYRGLYGTPARTGDCTQVFCGEFGIDFYTPRKPWRVELYTV